MGGLGGPPRGGGNPPPGGGPEKGGFRGGPGDPPRGRRSGFSEISCGAAHIKTRFFRAPKNTFIKRAARPRVPDFGPRGASPQTSIFSAPGAPGPVWGVDPLFWGYGGRGHFFSRKCTPSGTRPKIPIHSTRISKKQTTIYREAVRSGGAGERR